MARSAVRGRECKGHPDCSARFVGCHFKTLHLDDGDFRADAKATRCGAQPVGQNGTKTAPIGDILNQGGLANRIAETNRMVNQAALRAIHCEGNDRAGGNGVEAEVVAQVAEMDDAREVPIACVGCCEADGFILDTKRLRAGERLSLARGPP